MKEESPRYNPHDERHDLNNLICPFCSEKTSPASYNTITGLVKCDHCDQIFVKLVEPNPTIQNPKPPHQTAGYQSWILLTLVIIVLLMIGLVVSC